MSQESLGTSQGSDKEPPKVTWIRVHRQYLRPETLIAYDLPWDWDENDDHYIIIKKWITEDFQEELFAHSRDLREGRAFQTRSPDSDRPASQDFYSEGGSYEPSQSPESDWPALQDFSSAGGYYDPPKCVESKEPLSFDVNLKASAAERSKDEFRSDPSHRENLSQRINILSSRIPGYGKVVLRRADATVADEELQFSWIHMQTETSSFDDFLRFATNIPSLANEDRALVSSLLKKAGSQIGGFGRFPDVMRCVGLSSTVREGKSAIFLRFPYFSMKDAAHYGGPGHHIRSLFQYCYGLESTKKRDLEQAIHKSGLSQKGEIIHVSELWAVIVNFKFIITSAPITQVGRARSSLEIIDLPASRTPSAICVIDPHQREFFLEIDRCKTYFAMRNNVIQNCLPQNFKDRADFELRTSEGIVVKEEDWVRITTCHGPAVLRFHIQLLSSAGYEERNEKYHHQTKFSSIKEAKLAEKVPVNNDYREAKIEVTTGGMEVPEQEPLEEESLKPEEVDQDKRRESALPAYAEPTHASREGGRVRRFELKKRPDPPSSGVVVNHDYNPNKNSNGNVPSASNIYFKPVISNSSSKKEPDTSAKSVPDHPKGDSYGKKECKVAEPQFRRSPTLDSIFGEPSTPQDSSQASDLRGEIITDASRDIEKRLEGETQTRGIYSKGTTKSYFEADKAVRQQWAISLPALIATVEKSDTLDLPPWETSLRETVVDLCRLFNFFLPLGHPCTVGSKFWGAIYDLVTIIPQMCDRSKVVDLTERTRRPRMTEYFLIADIGDPKHVDLRSQKDLDISFTDLTDCRKCGRLHQYSKRSGALDHQFNDHSLQPRTEQRSIAISESQWVMDIGCYLNFSCRKDGLRILRQLKDFATSIEQVAFKIQNGVSVNGRLDEETYSIPRKLITAFQHFLMMTVTGAYMAKSAHETRQAYNGADPLLSFLGRSASLKIVGFGAKAENSIRDAVEDIVIMTYTDQPSDVVTYQAASPSLVIALLLGDNDGCSDSENRHLSLINSYRDYVQGLQFKVGQHPNRRLLRDIYLAREELMIIDQIFTEQDVVLTNYLRVLEPTSFRVTTESRISAYELEEKQLDEQIDKVEADRTKIRILVEKLDSLAVQTSNGVDVRQEDQAKAILVFTIVTVIFLSLSFFTSYLGMNTSDIRNMESTQSLFWTISLPITMVIITSILFVAFQADSIRERFDTLFTKYRAVPMAAPTQAVSRVEGASKGGIHPKFSSGMGWSENGWLARRRAGWKSRSDENFDV